MVGIYSGNIEGWAEVVIPWEDVVHILDNQIRSIQFSPLKNWSCVFSKKCFSVWRK